MLTPKRIYHGIKRRVLRSIQKYQPKIYADYLYYRSFGKHINWEQPEDLNQWINWLAFNTDTSQWSMLADKYAVRKYVAEKGFENALVPLLAIWDKPDEITFDKLPSKFVLKINNGSGDVLIIRNKENADLQGIKLYFKSLFHHPFGIDTAEPHYQRIKPKIIAEPLLEDATDKASNSSLIDYKFWCFNGVPYWCFVCSARTREHLTIDLYSADEKWERLENGNLDYPPHYKKALNETERPRALTKMLNIVSKLSIGLPQVRIDLYEVNNQIYFGEMTMTSAAGRMEYFTESALKEMGKLCKDACGKLCMMCL